MPIIIIIAAETQKPPMAIYKQAFHVLILKFITKSTSDLDPSHHPLKLNFIITSSLVVSTCQNHNTHTNTFIQMPQKTLMLTFDSLLFQIVLSISPADLPSANKEVFYIQILADLSTLFSTMVQKARNTPIPWMLQVKLSLILLHFCEAELISFFLKVNILLYLRQ